MPSLSVLIQKGQVCQCLRAKTLFYEPPDAEGHPHGPEGPFWCAQTQSLLGPDGRVADAENCRPGRSCCETA
jgi:hypothetical protein